MRKRRCYIVLISIFMLVILSGCTRIRFSTGLSKSDFAKIGGEKISMKEANLLLSEQKYSYEKLFDPGIWKELIEDISAEEYVKDEVKNTIYHISLLNILADDLNVDITDKERDKINDAADEYFATLEDDESYDFTKSTVKDYYTRLLRADKAFYSVTEDVDTEVSEDEARIIDVQYIYISTEKAGEEGDSINMTDSEKHKKLSYAGSILKDLMDGADFVTTAQDKSDSTEYFKEFGTGDFDEAFTKAAFCLEVSELSDVVEGENGYYIIKCISDNVESDYTVRSKQIVLERRKELFNKKYENYIEKTTAEYNKKFFKDNTILSITNSSGKLNEIYDKYFVSTQID